MSHQAHVTLTDVEVDTIDTYAIISGGKAIGKLTVGAGANVQTINVRPGGYKPSIAIKAGAKVGQIIYDGNNESSIVIEEGAEVGEIIFNGVSYTLEEWRAR
jgi:hypothetical protein